MAKASTGYDKARLVELLRKLYQFTRDGAAESKDHRRLRILGGSGTRLSFTSPTGTFEAAVPDGDVPTLTIIDDGVDALDAFAGEVLKDEEFRDIIGRAAVQEHLETFLQSTKGQLPDEDIKDVVRFRILKPLRDAVQEWCSYVPIVNLVVQAPLRLGDVTFVPQKEAEDESRHFIEEHQFGGGDAEYQEQQREAILAQIASSGSAFPSFVKVKLRAHSKRVRDVAADKALIAVNVLRAHTHLFHSYSDRALIGLPTEMSTGSWQTTSLSTDSRHSFNMQNADRGPLMPFVLDARKLEHLTSRCYLGLIQEILDKPSQARNSLETVGVQAFQSLGRAIVAPTIDMRCLGCTISLERMLIRDREETTTERWSDRLAVVLGRDRAHRQVIIQRAKSLYDLRSRIVHAAYSGVSEADARLMERWAVSVVLSTLGRHREFSSHEEFCKKVDPREIGLSGQSGT